MTRSLAISARQITAICKGVAKAGFVAEVVINGTVVRLVPEGGAQSAASPSVNQRMDHMFESSHERARAQPPYDNEVGDYYRKLGYDPQTMNPDNE
jgi:putative alpha-1,2-mannosidase